VALCALLNFEAMLITLAERGSQGRACGGLMTNHAGNLHDRSDHRFLREMAGCDASFRLIARASINPVRNVAVKAAGQTVQQEAAHAQAKLA